MNQPIMQAVRDATRAGARPSNGMSPALLQRRLRDIHTYLGMLFAPSLLFFAITGALQLFNLHEAGPTGSFRPPALVQELGMVHKKQVFGLPHHRARAAEDAGATGLAPSPVPGSAGSEEDKTRIAWGTQILKFFFLLAAVGLVLSTGIGIWLGLKSARNRSVSAGLLLAGVIIPVALLAL